MLELINRFLAERGVSPIDDATYDVILAKVYDGFTVDAIKTLREATQYHTHRFFQVREGSGFAGFLMDQGVDSLKVESVGLGLKESKDVIDFLKDNWDLRYATA